MTESFGMMDGAYFVGKNEILKWVNQTYKLNMSKIEQACTGALYCQIIDSIHPNKVKMNKVNWKAKLEHEFIQNFKTLQQAFTDCKISKNVEVERLVKGKYQDNLEFLQWMKRYYEEKRSTCEYDPILRRNGQELEITIESMNTGNQNKSKRDFSKTHKEISSQQSLNSNNNIKTLKSKKEDNKSNSSKSLNKFNPTNTINVISSNLNSDSNPFINSTTTNNNHQEENKNQEDENKAQQIDIESKLVEMTDTLRTHYQEKLDIVNDENSKLKMEVNTLKVSISGIGNSRDFYFTKLRDIEMLTVKENTLDRNELMEVIKTILFSKNEIELSFGDDGKVNVKNH